MDDFHERNKASTILAKIGDGCADADFARAVAQCINASKNTSKSSKVLLTVSIEVREDIGAVELRVDVTAKTPKLRSPATQMHLGPAGELVSQEDFLLEKWSSGGTREAPTPVANPASGSGRLKSVVAGGMSIAALPERAPVATVPPRAPIAGAESTPAS